MRSASSGPLNHCKEPLLWFRKFATIEELNEALRDFRHRYDHEWLIQRRGYRYRSPAQQRALLGVDSEAAV